MGQIILAERRANGTLNHHGTQDQIRAMVRKALEEDPLAGNQPLYEATPLLSKTGPAGAEKIIAGVIGSYAIPASTEAPIAAKSSEEKLIMERKALSDAYFSGFRVRFT